MSLEGMFGNDGRFLVITVLGGGTAGWGHQGFYMSSMHKAVPNEELSFPKCL